MWPCFDILCHALPLTSKCGCGHKRFAKVVLFAPAPNKLCFMQSCISDNKCAPLEYGAFCIPCEGGMGRLGEYYSLIGFLVSSSDLLRME